MRIEDQSPELMPTVTNIVSRLSLLPAGTPDIDYYSLFVVNMKPEIECGWVIVEHYRQTPQRYLCRDGVWRWAWYDYDDTREYFGNQDTQDYTDDDWRIRAERIDQYNRDRYMTYDEAVRLAVTRLDKIGPNNDTAAKYYARLNKLKEGDVSGISGVN